MGTIPSGVKPGDFFCVFVGSEVSRLIALGEWLNGDRFARTPGRQFSHAGIVVGVRHPRMGIQASIVEAEPGGACLVPWHYSGGCAVIWSTGVLEPSNRGAVVSVAEQMASRHVPYGWLNYPAIGLGRLGVSFSPLDRYIASGRSVICSQLVDLAWRAGGTVLRPDRPPGLITPQEEADLLMSLGAKPMHGR